MTTEEKKCAKVTDTGNLMKFLKKWRKDRKLSLNQMSRLTGLSPQTLNNLELKAKDISGSSLVAIVKGLGIDWGDAGRELEKELHGKE